jgi:hypothetical protein
MRRKLTGELKMGLLAAMSDGVCPSWRTGDVRVAVMELAPHVGSVTIIDGISKFDADAGCGDHPRGRNGTGAVS